MGKHTCSVSSVQQKYDNTNEWDSSCHSNEHTSPLKNQQHTSQECITHCKSETGDNYWNERDVLVWRTYHTGVHLVLQKGQQSSPNLICGRQDCLINRSISVIRAINKHTDWHSTKDKQSIVLLKLNKLKKSALSNNITGFYNSLCSHSTYIFLLYRLKIERGEGGVLRKAQPVCLL